MTKTKDCNLYSLFKNSMLVMPCRNLTSWQHQQSNGQIMEKVVCVTNTSVYFGFIFIYLFDKPGKQPLSETSELDSIGNLYTRSGFYFSFEGSVCCWTLDGFWYQVLHVVNQSTLSLILLISPFRKCLTFFMKQSFSFASCFCLDWFRFLLKK